MALTQNLQASFTAGELAPSLHSRVDLAKYRTGAKSLHNWLIHPHGGISRRDGLEFVGAVGDETHPVRLFSFEASSNDTYILEFGHQYMRVYRGGILVQSSPGVVFSLDLPYTADDLPALVVEQSNDVLTVTHERHAPREIARYNHADWRVSVLNFAPPAGKPVITVDARAGYTTPPATGDAPTAGYVATDYKYAVTAVLEGGAETLMSTPVIGTNDLRWHPPNINVIEWADIPGALFYNVYKEDSGYYGLIGTTESTQFVDKNYKGDISQAPPKGRNPFNGANKYPRASAYFQQRRIFGGTVNQTQTTWGSVSGNFNNFTVARPAKDSDALEFTIAGRKLQKIRHYVALQDLIVFTETGEWRVRGTEGGIVTPTGSIAIMPQSEYGIGNVPPLVVGDQVLFVLRSGRQVRDLGYKFESDNYSGSDLTILSHHLFDTRRVVAWAHQKQPNSIIWCVMDDGTLCSLTYMREHEVWAWAPHATDGAVESVAVVSENNVDVPYFAVQRQIGAGYRRYIERMRPDRPAGREFAFYVDSGLSYYGPPVSAVGGLSHLEGRQVVGLADGAVIGLDGELTVSGGAVALPFAAERIHLGLPFESRFESLSFALNDRVAEGVIKAVGEVVVTVQNTSGIEAGGSFDDMNEHKARTFEDYGDAPGLYSEPISIVAGGDYNTGGRVCIRQRYPLPATILALAPKIDYAG